MRANRSIIYVTILVALVLQIIPMPTEVDAYRPDWLLIILCYWGMALPHRVSVGVAATCGIILDLLFGTSLGVHSIALAIPIFIVNANCQKLRNQSMVQQMIALMLLSVVHHLCIYWVQYWVMSLEFRWSLFWPTLSTIILWPWIFWLLRKLRRQFNVA